MIERFVIAMSALIVASVIGWTGWAAFLESRSNPSFAFTIIESAKSGSPNQVLFEIRNGSSQTAADVVVRGEIMEGQRAVEAAEITFDFVPGNSKKSGAILFSKVPGGLPVRLRAVGYIVP